MFLRVVATALVWEFPPETEIDGLGEGLMLTGGPASVWVAEKSPNTPNTKERTRLRRTEPNPSLQDKIWSDSTELHLYFERNLDVLTALSSV